MANEDKNEAEATEESEASEVEEVEETEETEETEAVEAAAEEKQEKPKKPKKKRWRPKDRLKAGTKWLDTLFEKMMLEDIEVEAEVGDKVLQYNVHGGDSHLLLGAGKASAKALESIQTIMREALVNGYDTDYDVHLDVDNFRQRRTEHLEEVARELAETAASIGSSITVAGFNSFERRVVHQTLSEDKNVSTDSEGRGSFRKLRVEPR